MKVRFAIRRARLFETRLRTYSANKIQSMIHRKYVEYFSAVRVAGRRQLAKRRKREEEERIRQLMDKSARFIQRLFRGIVVWNKNMSFVEAARLQMRR